MESETERNIKVNCSFHNKTLQLMSIKMLDLLKDMEVSKSNCVREYMNPHETEKIKKGLIALRLMLPNIGPTYQEKLEMENKALKKYIKRLKRETKD